MVVENEFEIDLSVTSDANHHDSSGNPIYGIPDAILHTNLQPLAPSPWTRPRAVWDPIWKAGLTGKGITCCIADTGCHEHPDLPEMKFHAIFTGESSIRDGNGHGIHCSGSVVGRNGLSAAPEADFGHVKVLSNSGSGSNTVAGLRWVADNADRYNIEILSCSWGGGSSVDQSTEAALRALEDQGIWIFFAAGNSGYNGRNTVISPALSKHNVAVSSITETGAPSGFSSGGPAVDIAAGGSYIVSCNTRGGYATMSGTSMATPTLASDCTVLRQVMKREGMDVHMNSRELVQWIASEDFLKDGGIPGDDPRYGKGAINLQARILGFIQQKALKYA